MALFQACNLFLSTTVEGFFFQYFRGKQYSFNLMFLRAFSLRWFYYSCLHFLRYKPLIRVSRGNDHRI